MQAIQTRYLGCTNTRGSRIKAFCQAGSLTVPYEHRLNLDANHAAAASALVNKLGWTDPVYGGLESGTLPCGDYCHVLNGNAWKEAV